MQTPPEDESRYIYIKRPDFDYVLRVIPIKAVSYMILTMEFLCAYNGIFPFFAQSSYFQIIHNITSSESLPIKRWYDINIENVYLCKSYTMHFRYLAAVICLVYKIDTRRAAIWGSTESSKRR